MAFHLSKKLSFYGKTISNTNIMLNEPSCYKSEKVYKQCTLLVDIHNNLFNNLLFRKIAA